MANLKVFISSTCYDLHSIRGQLRNIMMDFGHEPIMSDQAEVIFDPQIHTHTSCLREVGNCDVVVLVIGSRFGGTIIPKALELIDMGRVIDMSRSDRFGENGAKISITQAEILQAIQHGIPVFAFVDSGVMRDHLTYEKNKNKPIINQIEFSSIEKTETAAYIFEFINYLRMRNENNSIFEFSRFEDIEIQLKKQWSGLFQRLLSEQRSKAYEGRHIEQLSSQIADLKAAVLGSISSVELKETAKGAIRFRMLIDFTHSLINEANSLEVNSLLRSNISWKELFTTLGIIEVRQASYSNRFNPYHSILLKDDGTYFRSRIPTMRISRLQAEWDDFKGLGSDAKDAIINAILDSRNGRTPSIVRHFNEPYIEDDASTLVTDDEDLGTDAPKPANDRVLLTKEKYIEESLKNFLSIDPSFTNMNFLIDVNSDSVKVAKLNLKGDRKVENFTFSYNAAEDSLTAPIEKLKEEIKNTITTTETDDN
ncbi:DUF4062 domain-containing protein [Pseudomonas sp. GL-B-26]|uniref:DUF4062 domain-containing protein n=1 Tax=Pseudomonas sp. GL-B-26 TaxID=2832394 RepID=UPI001CBE15E3|nr:DUF4062 domain-containing protein [Pseudomonas sp. GL-B-26]